MKEAEKQMLGHTVCKAPPGLTLRITSQDIEQFIPGIVMMVAGRYSSVLPSVLLIAGLLSTDDLVD